MATLDEILAHPEIYGQLNLATLLGTTLSPFGTSKSRASYYADPTVLSKVQKSVVSSSGDTIDNPIGIALSKRMAEQGNIDATTNDQLRAMTIDQAFSELPQAQLSPEAQTQKLRMADPLSLSTEDQQKQFFANQSGETGKELLGSLGLSKQETSSKPLDTGAKDISKIVEKDQHWGDLVRQQYGQLKQGPQGITFATSPSVEYRAGGGDIGGGGGGGIFGTFGRNTDTLRKVGAGIIGTGLGLVTGNPLLAVGLGVKGGMSGQPPTGMDVLGTLLAGELGTGLSPIMQRGLDSTKGKKPTFTQKPMESKMPNPQSLDYTDEDLNKLSNDEINELIRQLEAQ